MEIGETIKIIRENRGLSQNELAPLIHLTPSTLSRWESGQRKTEFTYEEIIEIITVLGISITDFEYIRKSDSPLAFYIKEYYKSYETDSDIPLKQAYRYFDKNRNESMNHLLFYLKIKKHFSKIKPDIIPAIEKEDMIQPSERLLAIEEYSQLDYQFMAAFTPEMTLVDEEIIEILFKKMLPVDSLPLFSKPEDFNIAVTQLLNNAVNHYLVKKKFSVAQVYLDYLKNHLLEFPLFDFHCFVNTYQQIIDYQEEKDIMKLLTVKEYISAINTLDYPNLESSLTDDFNNFFIKNDIDPLTQNNYLMN